MTIDEAIKVIQETSKECKQELRDCLNLALATDISIPDYDKIKSRRVLYTKYADIVTLNNNIGCTLLSARKLLLTIRELKSVVVDSQSVNYNLAKTYKIKIDKEVESLNELLSSLTEFKQSLDATLRFYSSLQYVLTTYKLGGDSYE